MKPISFPLLALLIVVFADAAPAQAPCSDPDCTASMPAADACRIYVDSGNGAGRYTATVIRGRIVNYVRAQPDGCYDPSRRYGLQGWRLTMRDDHKIRRIAVLQGPGSLSFALQDNDGGDYMDGFVWLVPLPRGTVIHDTSARECTGNCTLTLDPKDPDDIIVLVGFDVTRVSGDGHVKRFSVGPAVGTATNPAMQLNFSDDDFAYRARVQYAYLPAGALGARGDVQGSFARAGDEDEIVRAPGPSPNLRAATPRGNTVLQSFVLTFRNGGHFLEDVGIERRDGGYEAWFQDGQSDDDRRYPDDPFAWRTRFVILN